MPSGLIDNGDGTITDGHTGLMWEQKVGIGGFGPLDLHDADATFRWAGQCTLSRSLCQLNAAASAACVAQARVNDIGCAVCAPGGGECERGNATIWVWIQQLNDSNFAGHNDWRIPTAEEFATIINYSAKRPAVLGAFHGEDCSADCVDETAVRCGCTQSGGYWTATSFELHPLLAWRVNFDDGRVRYDGKGAGGIYARAVRGAPIAVPTPRFVDNGDGTITDRQTGLMWERKIRSSADATGNLHSSDGRYYWAGGCQLTSDLCQPNPAAAATCARQSVNDQIGCDMCPPAAGQCGLFGGSTVWQWINELNAGSGFGGYTDWRIPTIVELYSIYDFTHDYPAIDPLFNGQDCGSTCLEIADSRCGCTDPVEYVSSTSAWQGPLNVWSIDYGHFDGVSRYAVKGGEWAVRAVRHVGR